MCLQSLQHPSKHRKWKCTDSPVAVAILHPKLMQDIGVVVVAVVESPNTQQDEAAGHPLLGLDPPLLLLRGEAKDVLDAQRVWQKVLWVVMVQEAWRECHWID
jgi:hypothetical protein